MSDNVQRSVLADPELEVRAKPDGASVIRGYAAVFNSESQDLGGFIEVIRPGAFDRVLKSNPDVSARVQHEGGLTTLGRTTNGTLRLGTDSKGLWYEIDPPDTQAGRDITTLIKQRYIDKSSFAFAVGKEGQRWNFDRQPALREIVDVDRLVDVSPVDGPAFEATTVSARAAAAETLEQARAEYAAAVEEATAAPEPEHKPTVAELRQVLAQELADARGQAYAHLYEERFEPNCAAQHLGLWAVKGDWLTATLGLIKARLWHAEKYAQTDSEPHYRIQGDGIAVINLIGQLAKGRSKFGGTSTVLARKAVRQASNDSNVKAVLLYIDSPGGTVAGTEQFADEVYRANLRKPVFAYASDTCASAAYWVASQARKIYASPTTEIGSIGTLAVVYDESGAAAMAGVKAHVVSTGPYKGAFAPGAPVVPEHLAYLQERVEDLNGYFVRAVAHGRGLSEEKVRELADGRDWLAERARILGLIDEVKSFDEALEDIAFSLFVEEAKGAQ